MVSKAIGRQKGPINGAANIKPYRREEKPRLLDVDFYFYLWKIIKSFA